MATLMQSDKPIRVVRNGVDARFEAGKPRPVRDSLVDAAARMGAYRVGEEPSKEAEKPEKVESDGVTQTDDPTVRLAIQQMLEFGESNEFSEDGVPKVKALSQRLGVRINAETRNRVWNAMNEADG